MSAHGSNHIFRCAQYENVSDNELPLMRSHFRPRVSLSSSLLIARVVGGQQLLKIADLEIVK